MPQAMTQYVTRRAFTFRGRRYRPGDVFDAECPGYKLSGLQSVRIIEACQIQKGDGSIEVEIEGSGRRRRKGR